ncbi:hypothetical protein F4678DRAFT_443680 [Xylaria arbuscula]|nr:hypothetical protein F4678DRAFT_443680 [Xylaria arbuscula]
MCRSGEGFFSLTTFHRATRARDEHFTIAVLESTAVTHLRKEIAALWSFAQYPDVHGSIRRPLMVYIYALLKQFETVGKRGWFINAVRKVHISESPISTSLRICLVLLSLFIIAVIVLPGVIAFTISERSFNARTLPAQSRTGIEILSMLSFPQTNLRLAWAFAVERLALLIANTIAYSFVAWNRGCSKCCDSQCA